MHRTQSSYDRYGRNIPDYASKEIRKKSHREFLTYVQAGLVDFHIDPIRMSTHAKHRCAERRLSAQDAIRNKPVQAAPIIRGNTIVTVLNRYNPDPTLVINGVKWYVESVLPPHSRLIGCTIGKGGAEIRSLESLVTNSKILFAEYNNMFQIRCLTAYGVYFLKNIILELWKANRFGLYEVYRGQKFVDAIKNPIVEQSKFVQAGRVSIHVNDGVVVIVTHSEKWLVGVTQLIGQLLPLDANKARVSLNDKTETMNSSNGVMVTTTTSSNWNETTALQHHAAHGENKDKPLTVCPNRWDESDSSSDSDTCVARDRQFLKIRRQSTTKMKQ